MSEPPDTDTFRAWWRAQTGGTYPVEPIAKPTDAPASRDGLRDRITKIVVDYLGVDAEKVTDTAGFIDDLGADSLDQVELVMAFEEEFGIEIPDDEMLSILTVGDAISYVGKKVAAL
ncbi:acyl carrier protein [Mesorhizobium sp. M1D.F.Ca.ET.184.01.1.1]|nr:acyl carrier protein [Mesorhizobium sp. M1D.F.Ca.ET.231.01.1.1]TGP24754.1 acyl carrier protein [Mesorhizobium sp. M1D.F.Ca.ET.234.01.1.1]TGS37357.1 acyl carrier protein [Mesorhizobium sp. M1D.F.Ca.ET.184.01.1.1]TGS58157.1 acyl carrier protein [Mesorhizobium sp. M1D.F.Ca.ET.183.01.1.1]